MLAGRQWNARVLLLPPSPHSEKAGKGRKQKGKAMTDKSKNFGHFIPLEADLFERVKEGALNPIEFCIYCTVLYQIDYETGFWRGSAPRLQAAWGGRLGERNIQEALNSLGKKGYLRSFHKRGSRSNYLVAVHNYPIRYGIRLGHRLDAKATVNPENPVYVSQRTVQEDNSDRSSPARPSALTEPSQCGDAGFSVQPNAGIPDISSRYKDPSKYPDPPRMSWLVKRMGELLSQKLKAVIRATRLERARVNFLEEQHGTLMVFRAFFPSYLRGVVGLTD
jgi:hypothetical protein